MEEQFPQPKSISLARALRKGFRAAYDHLGYVVFVTFASFLITAVLFTCAAVVGRGISFVLSLLLLSPPVLLGAYLCAVGVFFFAEKSVSAEHPVLADTWKGISTLLAPALKLFIVDLVITVVLLGDTLFFLSMIKASGGALFTVLGILFGYLTFVWLMMMLYHLPLLAAQLKMESGPGPFVILRKSFLLTADNPGFTLGLFLAIIAFAVLCALPGLLGLVTFYLGAAAFILTSALRELFIKYGIVEEERDVTEDNWSLPESWLKRNKAGGAPDDGNDA